MEWHVPLVGAAWDGAEDLLALPWEDAGPPRPLVRSDGGGPPSQATTARLCHTRRSLYVRFECDDADIWGTYTKRDDPLWREEAVEVFLAEGEADPAEYHEFEVSPNGVLFDALVRNPTSRREDLVADTRWDCPGLRWCARVRREEARWLAALAIPWSGIGASGAPRVCRANLYRIDRPRAGDAEFSAWSPTFARPADFHRPSRFGRLVLLPEGSS
jgi:hypothetical protein